MSRKKREPSTTSWRDIQQRNQGAKTTKVARRRRLAFYFRGAFFLFLFIAIVTGILGIYYFATLKREAPPVASVNPVELVFKSDGVLTEDWFREQHGKVLYSELRGIDVGAVKQRLESNGQIAMASVTVSLPDKLVIRIEEREPILRLRVRGRDGRPQVLLLARDGTLYPGAGYPPDTLKRLPGVAGLRVREIEDGYASVEGLESVSYLLETAKTTLPSIYRHWRVVDLSEWDPELSYRSGLIHIRSSHIEELVFSTDDIDAQIERLAGILEHTQRYQMGQPKFIDLSYKDEAVIRYN